MRLVLLAPLLALTLAVTGCANLKPPRTQATAGCPTDTARSICLSERIIAEYRRYGNGADTGQSITDSVVLSAAMVGVIGAATGSKSELYKAAGGIALSALGVSEYANFSAQNKITLEALTRIDKAQVCLNKLSELEKNKALIQSSKSQVFSKYTVAAPTQSELIEALNLLNTVQSAEDIIGSYDNDVVTILHAIQSSVRQQIKKDSFDLKEAIAVITQKPTPTPTPQLLALTGSNYSAEVLSNYKCVMTHLVGAQNN